MKPTFDIFGLSIDAYTLFLALGMILSLVVVLLKNKIRSKEEKVAWKDIIFLAVFVLCGALVGARLLYFITRIPDINSFKDAIDFIWNKGGLVFYGGVIGGFTMAMVYFKVYHLDPQKFMDLIIPVIPLGHSLGRVGCYFAGCCYGKVTNSSLGVHFPFMEEGVKVIPVQLYEAIFLFVLFVVLLIVEYLIKSHKPFSRSGYYFVFYGIWRFIIEFFRGDEIRGIFILSTSQWISLILIAFGAYMIFGNLGKYKLFKYTPKEVK